MSHILSSTVQFSTSGSIQSLNAVDFNTAMSQSSAAGRLIWNSADGTLELGLSGSRTIHKLGQSSFYRVKSGYTGSLAKGSPVSLAGIDAASSTLLVQPLRADGNTPLTNFIGLVSENISSASFGYVITTGKLDGIETTGTGSSALGYQNESWAAGDLLYVNSNVRGKLTKVAPPQQIPIGFVTKAAATGSIFIRVAGSGAGGAGGGGSATVYVGDTAPTSSVASGSLWWNSSTGNLFVQTQVPTGATYAPATSTVAAQISASYALTASYALNAGSPVFIGTTPPGSLPSGSLWWNETDGNLYIQAKIPTGSLYVPATATTAPQVSASYATTASYVEKAEAIVRVSADLPTTDKTGSIWYNTDDGNTYVLVSASTWVPTITSLISSNVPSSSVSISSSHAVNADQAINALTASIATSASYALSSSHADAAVTASHALTASYIKPIAIDIVGLPQQNFTASKMDAQIMLLSMSYDTVSLTTSSHWTLAQAVPYAVTASYAMNGGGGGNASVFVSENPPSGSQVSGSLWWDSSDGNLYIQTLGPTGSVWVGATNTTAGSNFGATYRGDFAGSQWTVNHNLGTTSPIVQVYSGSNQMIPSAITATTSAQVVVDFAEAISGSIVVSTGIGGITSASLALTATTASYAQTATSASYAATASFASSTYVEYVGMYMTANQTGVGNGTDVNLVSDISKNMTVSSNTVTLKAGVTYEISGQVRTFAFSNDATGYADFALVNASDNSYLGWTSYASTLSSSSTLGFMASPSIVGIIKPTSDVTVKLRCLVANGTCTIEGAGTRLAIKAIDFS